MRAERLVEPPREAVARDPRQQVVVRDPVRAPDEHRHPVDDDREPRAVLVVARVDLDRAEADAPGPRVEDGGGGGLVGDELHLEPVQRLLAVPGGPPQPRRGHRERDDRVAGVGGDDDLALDAGDPRPDPQTGTVSRLRPGA